MVIDEELFAGSELKPKVVTCPHCGGTHAWNKKQAILAR
jgi:hypothetical protein